MLPPSDHEAFRNIWDFNRSLGKAAWTPEMTWSNLTKSANTIKLKCLKEGKKTIKTVNKKLQDVCAEKINGRNRPLLIEF